MNKTESQPLTLVKESWYMPEVKRFWPCHVVGPQEVLLVLSIKEG
jgi:hypothetical protein